MSLSESVESLAHPFAQIVQNPKQLLLSPSLSSDQDQEEKKKSRAMADWGPILIGVILFVLLQPGLLFQFPGNNKQLEFGSMKTNGKAIAVHTLFFFAIYAILTLALHIHIYTG